MAIVINLKKAIGYYCRLLNLLFCVSLALNCTGQQVIVVYRCEEKPATHNIADGRTLDFPSKITMNTLTTSTKISTWVQDSVTFTNLGVFADGFQLFVAGAWEYRDKINEVKYSHKLFFGANEFVEEPLIDPGYSKCSGWVANAKNTKTILGFSCTQAVCKCDDQVRLAYYASAIPIIDGPYYFPSLPGLILEYDDSRFHYMATDINALEGAIKPPAPIKKISAGKYSQSDSRMVINQQTLAISNWVKLGRYYWVQ